MTTIEQPTVLKTTCGKFHIVMTKADAIKKGIPASAFEKIDQLDGEVTNKLSEADILTEREYRLNGQKIITGLGVGVTGLALGAAIILGGAFLWCAAGAVGIITGYSALKGKNIKNTTNNYLENKNIDFKA